MNRVHPRAYFFRDGAELTYHSANGRPVLGFGIPTGRIGNAACFNSITVRTTIDYELTESDFDGPVTVKVWEPGKKPVWFALASVATVEQTVAERKRIAQ